MTPTRLQRSRKKGSNLLEQSKKINGLDVVCVGRGSRWGNPFRVIQYDFDKKWAIKTDGTEKCSEILVSNCHAVYNTKQEAVLDAIRCYQLWLLPYTHESSSMEDFLLSAAVMEDAKLNLKGKNLACWCGLDEICHADVLLKIAND